MQDISYELIERHVSQLKTCSRTEVLISESSIAFNLAVANEDHNIYIFDVRKMTRALNVLRDHVAAVMDVSFSPTGEELVSASYDRTIRLWERKGGHSRDIYHTKRMQRVFRCVFAELVCPSITLHEPLLKKYVLEFNGHL